MLYFIKSCSSSWMSKILILFRMWNYFIFIICYKYLLTKLRKQDFIIFIWIVNNFIIIIYNIYQK